LSVHSEGNQTFGILCPGELRMIFRTDIKKIICPRQLMDIGIRREKRLEVD